MFRTPVRCALLALALALASSCATGSAPEEPVEPAEPQEEVAPDPEPLAQQPAEPADPCASIQTELQTTGHELLQTFASHYTDDQNVQILITEVTPEGCSATYGHRVDERYFYPASALKTVASIGALHLLHGDQQDADSREPPWTLDTPLRVGDHETTLRQLVEETQVISSNPGFNALFEIVGFDEIHELFWPLGYESLRIRHRLFSRLTLAAERFTPDVWLLPAADANGDGDEEPRLLIEERHGTLDLGAHPAHGTDVGRAHIDIWSRELRQEPMDFNTRNGLNLQDHHHLMLAIFTPDLTEHALPPLGENLEFLRETLEMDPVEYARERSLNLGDNVERRFRPLMPGLLRERSRDSFRYAGKGGRAYGFHMENALIQDTSTGHRIFVTAQIYVNPNEVLNDNQYAYDEVGFPFFEELGALVGRNL